MSRTSNYIKGLATGYTATFATIVVGLWLTPYTLRFLDREEYAVFTLASDVLMWLGLLDLGISAGLNVQAAQLSGKPDQEKLNRLASTAFFTQNVIVLAILLVGGALAVGFPHFFPVRPGLQHTTTALVALLVISSAIGFSTRTFSALLVANQQIHVDNLIRLALLAIRTILIVVLLKQGWGLFSLAAGTLVATIVTSAMAVARTFRLLPRLKIRWRLASWEILKSIGSLGIWFSLGGLAGIVITCLDRVVAAKLITVESVTTLSLTGRVYALCGGLLDQLTNTARPALGQLFGKGNKKEAARAFGQLFPLSTGVTTLVVFSAWAGNEPFVCRWVGGQNYGGFLLNTALAANLLLNSWILPSRALLSAALVVKPQVIARITEACCNLSLSLILGHYFGLPGVVLGTAVAACITSLWYLPLLTARVFERSYFHFVRQTALPSLELAACLLPVAYLMRGLGSHIGGFIGAGVGAGITALTGCGLMWFITLDDTLRNRAALLLTKYVGVLLRPCHDTGSKRSV